MKLDDVVAVLIPVVAVVVGVPAMYFGLYALALRKQRISWGEWRAFKAIQRESRKS